MDELKSYNELLSEGFGYVGVSFSILDNPIWTAEEFTQGQAYVDLWMRVAPERCLCHKAIGAKSMDIMLQKGQICASLDELATRWKWGKKKVRGFLSRLQKEGKIKRENIPVDKNAQDGSAKISVITLNECAYRPKLGYQDFTED